MRITNATVVTPWKVLDEGGVRIEDGRIAGLLERGSATAGEGGSEGDELFDAQGGTLLPGFIDTHCHGCLGRDFMELDAGHWQGVSAFLAAHGVTGFTPTCTSAPAAATGDFLEFTARMRETGELPGAAVLGAHLEGPYLNGAYAGMMPPGCLREPDASEYRPWLRSGQVARMTASLELPGGLELLAACREAGVLMSLGHTVCSAAQVGEWARAGLRHVTHLYNAMSRAEKRGPTRWCGCLEGALSERGVSAEIIGDGFHAPAPLFRVAAACKGAGGLTLASDSTPATGAVREGERFRYGGDSGQELVVRGGMALSVDEKYLVGSICPLGDMFARVLKWMDGDLRGVAAMFATNIADLLGLGGNKGRIAVGCEADLVLLDGDWVVRATWVRGRQVYLRG